MSRLLALPREIRDQVIEEVICSSSASPPASIRRSTITRRPCYDFQLKSSGSKNFEVHYLEEADAYIPNINGLLLTNHQLYHEAVSRLQAREAPYTLDIKIVNTLELYPTWTCIPASRNHHISDVIATIQAVGEAPAEFYRSGYYNTGTHPSKLNVAFTALLVRFLRHGPVPPFSDEEIDAKIQQEGDITVGTLHLNVIEPDLSTPSDHRYYTARFIASYLNSRLETIMGYYPVNYGDIVYRRIGKICLTISGKPFRTWDFTRHLAFVPHIESGSTGPGYTNRLALRKWFDEVCEERKAAGLGSPPKDAWTTCDEEELMNYRMEINRWR